MGTDTLMPPPPAAILCNKEETETCPIAEEDIPLAEQLMEIIARVEPRMQQFCTAMLEVLAAPLGSEARKAALEKVDELIHRLRAEGGFGGHLPTQVKKHPRLRLAIWALFYRAFGLNSFGEVFRPKTSNKVVAEATEQPPKEERPTRPWRPMGAERAMAMGSPQMGQTPWQRRKKQAI